LVKNYDVKILIFGSKEEEKLINKIYTEVGERSYPIIGLKLSILIGIIKTCRLLVSNDSGIMHISSAVKVPTVGIFGSTSPVWTAPIGENNEIVYKSLSCSPCFKRYCKRKDYACLNEISVEEVEEKVKKLLKLT
jgi:ADP-heptose:LPS heptosyltransferase